MLVLDDVDAAILFLAGISLVYHVAKDAGRVFVFRLVLRELLELLLQSFDVSALLLNNHRVLHLLDLAELLHLELLLHLGL